MNMSREKFTIELYRHDLGEDIRGLSSPRKNEPGTFMIILNQKDSEVEQLATFYHEMTHIYSHDFDKTESVQKIESRAHSLTLQALEALRTRD